MRTEPDMTAKLKLFAGPSRPDENAADDIYDDGRLRVEHDNYYVAWDGQPLKFPRTEFLLLSRLVLNAARIVRAEELWRHAWGDGKPYNAESLHVHIYRLRNKLTPFGMQIETMVNVGYRLLAATEAARPPREDARAPARQRRA